MLTPNKTPKGPSPWDVKLSPAKREDFESWLCDEIIAAKDARSVTVEEVQYWWTIYEQGRTRLGKNAPWQDAADLTSYLGTEKVDALRARMMRTIMVDPVYTVEGWGVSAKKAPFVEEFHQWQIEAEGLQSYLARAIHASLIEPRGVLEVYQDTTERVVRKTIRAQVATADDGTWQLDGETMEPVLMQAEDGTYIEAQDEMTPSAEVVIDAVERVRKGPGYRVLSYDHFLVLPAHAREKADIWGYAKRFTRRWDQLQADAKAGTYDTAAVEALNDTSDVTSELTPAGRPVLIAAQEGPTVEKELWELQVLHNLDGKGLRWYVATVHLPTRTLLRVKYDDINQGRFILLVPFPRTDRSHEGYSFIGNKLITVIEEHTAWRNMLADRAAMVISAPIKRLVGALWDPDDQPFGPKAIIDVRDMGEVMPMDVPDLSQAAMGREQEIVGASERVAGINDVALGQVPQNSRTLGEVNLVAEQSFVRMDEVIKNIQEPLEELGQIRQAIWINTLKEAGERGIPMPQTMALGLDHRGGEPTEGDQSITAERLEGTYRFKPRGSTENADISKQRADYIQWMQMIGQLLKVWPAMAQVLAMNIPAARSSLEQALRLFRVSDKQAWIGNEDQWQMMMPQPPGMGPGVGGPPGAPGAPGGGMPPGVPPEIAAMLGGPPQGGQ